MRRDRGEGPDASPTLAPAVGVELVWLPSTGGQTTTIAPISAFGRPHFVTADTSHVYLTEGGGLVSMRWDGTDQKTILRVAGGGGGTGGAGVDVMTMSPDGQRVLLQSGIHSYLIQSVPATGAAPPTINVGMPAQSQVPVRKLTTVGGEFSSWSRDGK